MQYILPYGCLCERVCESVCCISKRWGIRVFWLWSGRVLIGKLRLYRHHRAPLFRKVVDIEASLVASLGNGGGGVRECVGGSGGGNVMLKYQ